MCVGRICGIPSGSSKDQPTSSRSCMDKVLQDIRSYDIAHNSRSTQIPFYLPSKRFMIIVTINLKITLVLRVLRFQDTLRASRHWRYLRCLYVLCADSLEKILFLLIVYNLEHRISSVSVHYAKPA